MKRYGVILIGVLGVAGVLASDTTESILAGNQKFADGDYEGALSIYDELAFDRDDETGTSSKPDCPPELLHNIATAHFKLGQYEEAADAWVRASSRGDAKFEGQCHYNLGNVNYAQARAAQQAGKLDEAIAFCNKANEHYRESLQLDRNLDDARVNMELTCKLLKELNEQSEQQQEQQDPNSQCDNPQDPNQPGDQKQ